MNFEVGFMPKYNLNKRKGTKIILLILALSFIVGPIIILVLHMLEILR